ncbi:hypothetical protein [Coleofasciculus sp.]|uniref:hypothetical protein n=1 Tax=Coleofasciculus sp. TaxID=3100458 RepID=UPI0039F8C6B4
MNRLMKSVSPILSITLLVVLVGCSQGEEPVATETPITAEPSPEVIPVSTSPEPSSSQPNIDAYTQAIDHAMGAAIIGQSAVGEQDWNLAASRWEKAISLLKTVPNSHPNFAIAQKKISTYQRNLAIIETNLKEAQRDYFQESLQLGMKAAQAAQSAQGLSDWQQVANKWELAIKSLETVPNRSKNYSRARTKIIEYKQNLSVANEKITDAVTAKYCQPQVDPIESEGLVVSNLQLYSEPTDEENFVYGCITNQSNQSLSSIGVTYGYMYENGFGAGLTSLTDYDFTLNPGKTMFFKSSFSFNKNVPEVELSFSSEAGTVDTIITR